MSSTVLHQAFRYHCLERIAAAEPSAGRDIHAFVQWYVWSQFLTEAEQYTPDDFSSEAEAQEVLKWIVQSTQVYCQQHYARRVPRAIQEADDRLVQSFIDQAGEQATALLQTAATRVDTPPVPFRRVLTQPEYREVWSTFQDKWGKQRSGLYMDLPIDALTKHLLQRGDTRLYYLHPFAHLQSYTLAAEWLNKMFSYDDGYWIALDFSWYILADGNGYPKVGGQWLEEWLKHHG
ncbi:hypothetical protein IC235_20930 [Hymenobacter sp. BT664]|uniref:Uncharacterized protein n=1 Tax=Hymenobacter montanus TaxID=2771359 RepID=A0A927BHQ4_9BACT|nr:hypothetical protein [Hymenobacter montanus]MBD2770359.1 hypothetical protein [Hymenobacter montanus]